MTAVADAGWAFFGAGLLAVLGYVLRYREMTILVSAFTSPGPDSDPESTARAAGTGALLISIPLAAYGATLLVGVGNATVAFVAFVLAFLVFYRAIHWVSRADNSY